MIFICSCISTSLSLQTDTFFGSLNKVIIIIIVTIIIVIIVTIIIIIITSETGITIYNYKSHRKLVNVKGLKKKID